MAKNELADILTDSLTFKCKGQLRNFSADIYWVIAAKISTVTAKL